jgi:hypothetical protein
MARGSQAQASRSRDFAGYQTHVYQGKRCDGCRHCRPASALIGKTRYDRSCALHRTPVKTHGNCDRWVAA